MSFAIAARNLNIARAWHWVHLCAHDKSLKSPYSGLRADGYSGLRADGGPL